MKCFFLIQIKNTVHSHSSKPISCGFFVFRNVRHFGFFSTWGILPSFVFYYISTEEHCGKCLPNWVLMNSTCFYFAVSSTTPRRGWNAGRDECKKKGADLVIIDSKEKQVRYKPSPSYYMVFSTVYCFKFCFLNWLKKKNS